MTICEGLLCRVLDSIPASASTMALSDMNYRAGEEHNQPFDALEAHQALPIAREIADVWCEGVVGDSITLTAMSRARRLDRKIERRRP